MLKGIKKGYGFTGTGGMYILSVLVLFCLFSTDLFAQESWYEGNSGGLAGIIDSVRGALVATCKVILLLGSGGALFFAIYNIIDGDTQGAKRFGIWLVGLLIGFIVLQVLGNATVSANSGRLSDFAGVKMTVKSVLMSLLCVVSMVTVVQKVFQLINGEKEGGRQLFKWFAVSLVGFVLLNII